MPIYLPTYPPPTEASTITSLTPVMYKQTKIHHQGETEWAKNGPHTGTTDIELTPRGIRQVRNTASLLVGSGKLLDPSRLIKVFVSPRKRAQQTFAGLVEG